MIFYLAKSGLCLALLLLFYHLVLEREKMHRFNRFYLLGSVLFSFLAPLFIIYIEAAPEIAQVIPVNANFELTGSTDVIVPIEQSIDYTTYLLYIYASISVILLVRFGKSLIDIVRKTLTNEIVLHEKAKIVLVNDKILPHTFWNYIFINKEEFKDEKIETELFTHELTHVTQRHTIDVLLIEALQVVLWINPFFFLLKKAVQLNHEFLADDKVIASHNNISRYQYLLLDKAAWKNKYYLASNLNYSLTKKRLLMMKKHNSKSTILLKKLAIVPLLTGLVFLFADRVEAQSKEVIEVVEQQIQATDAQMKEYKRILNKSLEKHMFKQQEIDELKRIYSVMSKKQKSSVKNIYQLVPPPPEYKENPISKSKYEELKNEKKYAIWIDGKVVDNKVLNNYKYSDFVSHIGSYVHKNARSKRFPQEYQYTLYKKAYFEKLKAKGKIARENFEKQIPPPPKPVKIEVKEIGATSNEMKDYRNFIAGFKGEKLAVKNSRLKKYKRIYAKMTRSQKESVENYKDFIPVPPLKKIYVKEVKTNKQPKPVKIEVIETEKRLPPPPPRRNGYEEIEEVIEEREVPIIEEIRELPEGVEEEEEVEKIKRLIEVQEVKELIEEREAIEELEEVAEKKEDIIEIQEEPKFHKGWYITIDGQRYYYTFDKYERIARYYKNGKLVDLDIVKEYKKKHKLFEKLKKNGKHYVFKTKAEKRKIDQEFSDLGGMYFRMSRKQKNAVPYPNNPRKPYLRLVKEDGTVYYKKRSELTDEDQKNIPPPPPSILSELKPGTSKEDIKKARKAYDEWSKRLKLIKKE